MRFGTAALALTGLALGALTARWLESARPEAHLQIARTAGLHDDSLTAVAQCVQLPRTQQTASPRQARPGLVNATAIPPVRESAPQRHADAESESNALYIEEHHADLGHILGKERFARLAARWGELQARQDLWEDVESNHEDAVQAELRELLDNHEFHTQPRLQEWIRQELGTEAVQQFVAYLRSIDVRKELQPLRTALINAGAALDGEQIELLVSAADDARAEFASQGSTLWDSDNWGTDAGERLAREIAAHDGEAQLIERRWQRLHDAAASALSSRQQQALEQALRRQVRAELLRLERHKLELIRRPPTGRRHYEDLRRY